MGNTTSSTSSNSSGSVTVTYQGTSESHDVQATTMVSKDSSGNVTFYNPNTGVSGSCTSKK